MPRKGLGTFKLASKSDSLTSQDLEDAVSKALGNMGIPTNIFVDPATVQAFNTVFTSKYPTDPFTAKFKNKIHGKLKVGTMDWDQAAVLQDAFDAFSRMGVLKHAPKE